MDIKEFSDKQLKAEVDRRESIRGGVWPREFALTVDSELETDEVFVQFLEEECGVMRGSSEFERATNALYDVSFDIEIERDGKTKIVKVGGRPVAEQNADDSPDKQ